MAKSRNAAPKRAHPIRRFFITLLFLILLPPALVLGLSAWMEASTQSRIYTNTGDVPREDVAIVFGAGLKPDGTPSTILADRVDAAASLYKQGKVARLIMTGDESSSSHPEVSSMRAYAIKRGVPSGAITRDQAGLRTYDSCWRAAHVFGVKKATLVTQGYHLPRAIYTCTAFGIETVGMKAGVDEYRNQDYYNTREILARFGAFVDVNIWKPTPGGD